MSENPVFSGMRLIMVSCELLVVSGQLIARKTTNNRSADADGEANNQQPTTNNQ